MPWGGRPALRVAVLVEVMGRETVLAPGLKRPKDSALQPSSVQSRSRLLPGRRLGPLPRIARHSIPRLPRERTVLLCRPRTYDLSTLCPVTPAVSSGRPLFPRASGPRGQLRGAPPGYLRVCWHFIRVAPGACCWRDSPSSRRRSRARNFAGGTAFERRLALADHRLRLLQLVPGSSSSG